MNYDALVLHDIIVALTTHKNKFALFQQIGSDLSARPDDWLATNLNTILCDIDRVCYSLLSEAGQPFCQTQGISTEGFLDLNDPTSRLKKLSSFLEGVTADKVDVMMRVIQSNKDRNLFFLSTLPQ